eukprot:1888871-Alexandrium_andersonii.AAC.1
MVALLSAQTCSATEKNRLLATGAHPSPSAAPSAMPANSALPELKAMVFRVETLCSPAHWPRPRLRM